MFFNSLSKTKLVYRQFHTSSPRHVHPLIWVFLKPALKGVAWITGRWERIFNRIFDEYSSLVSARSTRKWFRALPPEKRSVFFQHLHRNRFRYFGIFGTIGTAAGVGLIFTRIRNIICLFVYRYIIIHILKRHQLLDEDVIWWWILINWGFYLIWRKKKFVVLKVQHFEFFSSGYLDCIDVW